MPGVWWGHSCTAPCKTPEPHLVLQHGKEALRMITVGSPTNLGKLGLRVKLSGYTSHFGASLVAQMVKNLPAMQEIQVQSLGQEDPLEKGMATYSSILAWRIPWTEEAGRL